MSIKEKKSKEKIIGTVIELLRTEPIENITMRRIAKDAIVTLSTINYHFQSKDNLIDLAIEKAFTDTVGTWDEVYTNVKGNPITKLRILFKAGAKFIEIFPEIAKTSLIRELQNPSVKDSTTQLNFAYFQALKDIYGNEKSDQDLKLLAHMLISASQIGILRADVLKETIGYDFAKEDDRNYITDFIFDTIIQKRNK
ncbi:MAG: TetR/AcrR family transcriptional regulator [Asgard group archaeon]|nr:TetR/AcrR family transcriptional regulator [Asgard group archaeon]